MAISGLTSNCANLTSKNKSLPTVSTGSISLSLADCHKEWQSVADLLPPGSWRPHLGEILDPPLAVIPKHCVPLTHLM